ncbi:unnamed protein product [Urochloa humidicola]
MDIRTALTKITNGFVYATLLITVIYMYGRMLPALDSLGDKFKALSRQRSNLIDMLTQAIEAMELLLPEVCVQHGCDNKELLVRLVREWSSI